MAGELSGPPNSQKHGPKDLDEFAEKVASELSTYLGRPTEKAFTADGRVFSPL